MVFKSGIDVGRINKPKVEHLQKVS